MSCAAEPATADDVEFVTEHAPLLDGPIPSPSALVVDGETDVSVTPTFPAAVTVNVKTTAPPGASEPLKESLVCPAVGRGRGRVGEGVGARHRAHERGREQERLKGAARSSWESFRRQRCSPIGSPTFGRACTANTKRQSTDTR